MAQKHHFSLRLPQQVLDRLEEQAAARGATKTALAERYLAEAVWLPTILLPSERLTWTALSDKSARATLTDGTVTATAEFSFTPEGAIERITGDRYRAVGSGQVLTPTVGQHRAYTRIFGMMIPTEGEVTWLLASGPHTYWRGRIRSATYE